MRLFKHWPPRITPKYFARRIRLRCAKIWYGIPRHQPILIPHQQFGAIQRRKCWHARWNRGFSNVLEQSRLIRTHPPRWRKSGTRGILVHFFELNLSTVPATTSWLMSLLDTPLNQTKLSKKPWRGCDSERTGHSWRFLYSRTRLLQTRTVWGILFSSKSYLLRDAKPELANYHLQLSTRPRSELCCWKPHQPLLRNKSNPLLIILLSTIGRLRIEIYDGMALHLMTIRSSQSSTDQNLLLRHNDDAFDLSKVWPKTRFLLRVSANNLCTEQKTRTPPYIT